MILFSTFWSCKIQLAFIWLFELKLHYSCLTQGIVEVDFLLNNSSSSFFVEWMGGGGRDGVSYKGIIFRIVKTDVN